MFIFERQQGHPDHKNPVIAQISLSFVIAPAHPGVPIKRAIKRQVCARACFVYVICAASVR